AVDRQQVERAQRADLVDAARDAAATEDQSGLRAARTPPRGLASRLSFGGLLEPYDRAHAYPDYRSSPGPGYGLMVVSAQGGRLQSYGKCGVSPRHRPVVRGDRGRAPDVAGARQHLAGRLRHLNGDPDRLAG